MFIKKKSLKGFRLKSPPQRTKEEIDRAYTHHAVQHGHKSRIVTQLQKEIEDHCNQMISINAEGMALPPELPTTPEQTSTESDPT